MSCWQQQRDSGTVANKLQSLDRITPMKTREPSVNIPWVHLEFTCENTLSSPTETHWGQSVVPDCFLTDNQLRWLQMMPTRHGTKTHIEQLSNISHSGQRVASFFLPHTNPPAWRNMRKTVSQERMVNCYPQTGQLGKTRWWRPDIMLEKL